MSETVIAVQGLTKDYGGGRGVFGLDFACLLYTSPSPRDTR